MILDLFRLDGKVAVVTGAGRGIGATTAISLAEAGAAVACVARTREQVEGIAAAIRATGGRALAICDDVTREEDVTRIMHATTEAWGRLDILVNNSGGTGHGPVAARDSAVSRRISRRRKAVEKTGEQFLPASR